MRGRQAARRRRLLIACTGNRDTVRAVEKMLEEGRRARRERERSLRRWAMP